VHFFVAVSSTLLKQSSGFISAPTSTTLKSHRLLSSAVSVENVVSRLSTLQTMLKKYGAPGSEGCAIANDLVEVEEQNPDLHPHLYAIAQSSKTGNYICGLRRCYADDDPGYVSSTNTPWPIVESAPNSRGMTLLALNSEHLMRRIACESDFSGGEDGKETVSIYNEGLGNGILDSALDAPYEEGSVEKLGYGCDKYTLLRVGPFPDLYSTMALGHRDRGDEASSLIAAEASNGKFTGFGSTFLFYARLLSSFKSREDEARDAARMCLQLPLPSIGHLDSDFKEVSVLGQLADESDSNEEALSKLLDFYEKMRSKEADEGAAGSQSGKTEQQFVIDEANYLLDRTALGSANWNDVRSELADKYKEAGKEDMADFVNQK